jgi:hypothetical protein
MAASYKKNLLKIAKSPDKTFKILSEKLRFIKGFQNFLWGFDGFF